MRLFDFGLVRELDPREQVDDDFYCMSGNTGSLAYMATEVALNETYNLSACLLLWYCTVADSGS